MADAAANLGVTESAVSHQIRALETQLHVKLFDRSTGRLRLTPEGERYLARVAPALAELEAATAALLPAEGRRQVRLTLPPSLAATWLIPRLSRFEAANPAIDLDLVLTTRLVELARDQVDLAIRYGRGPWPGIRATRLLEDLATPVAAPGYLATSVADAPPDDAQLLANRSIPAEWEEWARARGVALPALSDALWFDTAEQALQVAEAGRGIAMGRWPYVDAPLSEGRLVAPFGAAGPTGAAYFLCHAEGAPPNAAARRLTGWLEEEAGSLSDIS